MSPARRNRLRYPVAFACVAMLLLASCHGSDKKAAPTTGSAVPSTDAKGKPRVSLALKLGSLQVQATEAPKPFDAATAKAILKLMNNYVSDGITRPLFTGSLSVGIVRNFAPSLTARVGPKGHDRAALTDEHVPEMTTVTGTVKRPLSLVGLEQGGKLLMIGAQFGLTVKGITAQGPLTISRIGNFVFEPNAAHQWRITGYDLIVRRDNGTTSTTQKAATTTTGG